MRREALNLLILLIILSIAGVFKISHAAEAAGLVEKAKEEGRLTAYLAMNAADAVSVQAAFEKKFPQIKVELVRAGAPAILQRILTEHRGRKIFADVVLGFGFIHYELGQQNLLARYESPERLYYAPQFKDKDGFWTNVMSIMHTIAYNAKYSSPPTCPAVTPTCCCLSGKAERE